MDRTISVSRSRTLDTLSPQGVDPQRTIAIKRDVHEYVIEADAAEFARAFRDVVTDAESVFGLIRVKRPESRLGMPFSLGERFQGCFSIERALRNTPALQGLLRSRLGRTVVGLIEDQMLSNYAEIVEMDLEPAPGQPYRMQYRYLAGTPIAGSSTFIIEPLDTGRCRFTQVFEYQEVDGVALMTFQRFGLKCHDQVVHEQVRQAAKLCGKRVASGTIPVEYAVFAAAGAA